MTRAGPRLVVGVVRVMLARTATLMTVLLRFVVVVMVMVLEAGRGGGLVAGAVGRESRQLQHGGGGAGECGAVLGGLGLVGQGHMFTLHDGRHDACGHAVTHHRHLQRRHALHKGRPHLHMVQVLHFVHFGTRQRVGSLRATCQRVGLGTRASEGGSVGVVLLPGEGRLGILRFALLRLLHLDSLLHLLLKKTQ